VDVHSSTTQIPYTFTGMLGSTTVFAISGRQANTFGNFATVWPAVNPAHRSTRC
jgi:hypothetical protein